MDGNNQKKSPEKKREILPLFIAIAIGVILGNIVYSLLGFPAEAFSEKEILLVSERQTEKVDMDGRFMQIKESQNLGYIVDVYETPQGPGYRVYWEEGDTIHSRGYGSVVDLYTYDIEIIAPPVIASSTTE